MSPLTPLRVLMVNTYQTAGGAGRVGQTLANMLRDAGHRVDAFVAANPTGDPHSRNASHWRFAGLARRLSRWGFSDLAHLPSFAWRLRPEFAAADVIHLHNLHGDYVSLLALPLWGLHKPIVWTLHDNWALTGNCATPRGCTRWRAGCGRCPELGRYPLGAVDRTRFYRWLKPRLIAASGAELVCPSRWLERRVACVRELARLRRRVVNNGVDLATFRPLADRAVARMRLSLAPGRPTVIVVGVTWSDPNKGGADAARALAAAAIAAPQLQVIVVGDGAESLRDAVRRAWTAAAAPRTPRAAPLCSLLDDRSWRCIPFVSDRAVLAELYGAADVCLFPSRGENYPLTVLESLACGAPVVAYDVGGVPEQVDDGRTGRIVADGDAAALGAALGALLSDPHRLREMSAAAARSAATVADALHMRDRYLGVYYDAIARWRALRGERPTAPRSAARRAAARPPGLDDSRAVAALTPVGAAT